MFLNGAVVVFIVSMKTTLDLYQAVNSMDTHKHGNKDKLLIKSFFLFN